MGHDTALVWMPALWVITCRRVTRRLVQTHDANQSDLKPKSPT